MRKVITTIIAILSVIVFILPCYAMEKLPDGASYEDVASRITELRTKLEKVPTSELNSLRSELISLISPVNVSKKQGYNGYDEQRIVDFMITEIKAERNDAEAQLRISEVYNSGGSSYEPSYGSSLQSHRVTVNSVACFEHEVGVKITYPTFSPQWMDKKYRDIWENKFEWHDYDCAKRAIKWAEKCLNNSNSTNNQKLAAIDIIIKNQKLLSKYNTKGYTDVENMNARIGYLNEAKKYAQIALSITTSMKQYGKAKGYQNSIELINREIQMVNKQYNDKNNVKKYLQ